MHSSGYEMVSIIEMDGTGGLVDKPGTIEIKIKSVRFKV